MKATEHDWKFQYCHPHNGEYWYECSKCGATDWIASHGTPDQLPKDCFMKLDLSVVKLNIGSGHHRAEGWTNLDRSLEVKPDILFDLADIPEKRIPLLSDSVDMFLCSHILEHIPNILPVMQELYRIAKPGASMCVRVPYGGSDIAYEDPTHCRYFFENSMSYFGQPAYARADYGYRGDWREKNRIISLHPKVKQAFGQGHKPSAEELIEVVRGYRNMATEIIFELEAVKPARPTTGNHEDPVQCSFIWDSNFEGIKYDS